MTAPARATVLFDGDCPLCQRLSRTLARLDWRGKLHFQNARDVPNLPITSPPLNPDRLLEEMHLVTPRGAILAGYRAFRWIAWRLPMFWPLAPLLYLPGVPWTGNKLYLWVARRRYRLAPCSHGVCRLPHRGGS